MTLQDWTRNGWLVENKSSPEEIRALLGVVDRDLHDCKASGLSADWRLNIAYNAALQIAIAALAAEGFRTTRESHHHRALHSLEMTMCVDTRTVAQLDAFRKKRNVSDYEQAGMISESEAEEMIALAGCLREHFLEWLRATHPDLVPDGDL